MKAEDVRLTELLEGPKQFVVPVFQRDYSWGTKQCLQLWKDIIRVGADQHSKAHFIGSVVYIAAEDGTAKISRWLLVDGQQRLTTVTLLLAALRNRISANVANDVASGAQDPLPTRPELNDYYLFNAYGAGDRRYKLQLRRADQETLGSLLNDKDPPANLSERIRENFDFFTERLADADLGIVYRGVKKLVAVNVCLARGQDDPQMIFESLNSTGLDLTQADLIRNFVLMRQDEHIQTQLYEDYWQPIETAFGVRYRTDFDKFVRDYLTLRLRPSKQLKADEIYQQFRNYFHSVDGTDSVEVILAELKRFGRYFVACSLGQEENPRLREAFGRLRVLVGVASTLLLRLYDCYDRTKSLTLDEFIEAVVLLESYIFRQAVCAMQPRSLGQVFASLAFRIKDDSPLLCLKVALQRQGKKRRFPTDSEFREALETRDIYDMRHCHYLLDRLENASRERIDTSDFTIEHIMPQKQELRSEWQSMLGSDWRSIHDTWLHRLGNITLTGYNSEYSDRSFADKKTIPRGFNESPLRLNKFVREASVWTEAEMERRGRELAAKAISVWPGLVVDVESVKRAELEEFKSQAEHFSLEKLDFDVESRALFDLLRPQVMGLGEEVIELCGPNSVVYRVYDFFVEVIPLKRRLRLLLNLDFDECDDPSQRARDATEYAFVVHASEAGGVLFSMRCPADVSPAVHLIRQAFASVED